MYNQLDLAAWSVEGQVESPSHQWFPIQLLGLYDWMCLAVVGVLACLDGYMNIALEQTEEYVGGQLKNKYGDAFIRGNNGEIKFKSVMIKISLCEFTCSMMLMSQIPSAY